jgi:hypothetical protein
MTMNPKTVMVSALAFVGAIVLILMSYTKPVSREIYTGLVYDRSLSPRDGCETVKTLAHRALSLSNGQRVKSTIKIFATGDSKTANEPVVVDLPPAPVKSGRVLEGRGKLAEDQSNFVNEAHRRCAELSHTEQSPIFLTMKRAVEYLRSYANRPVVELRLFVQTDLEENVEEPIKRALRSSSVPITGLPKIDNAEISIEICGYADTASEYTDSRGRKRPATQARNARSADRLTEVWRSVFTHPELVTFNPVCANN